MPQHLPPLAGIERRLPEEILAALERATSGKYRKGELSFLLVERLDPRLLEQHLPAFARMMRILRERLQAP